MSPPGGNGEDGHGGGDSGEPAGGTGGEARRETPADDLLADAVDRIAHQIKNPLQAVAMNLEVIRMRIRKRAPELWSDVERYGDAVDENVSVLDRRLRLLLRLGRRSPDESAEAVDVARLLRDFAEALQLHEERPALVVRPEGEQRAARVRPGYLLALAFDVWRAESGEAPDAPGIEITVRAREDAVVLEVPLRSRGGAAGADALPPAWRRAARRAGGRLELRSRDAVSVLRLRLPTDAPG